jgi:tRNA threonylcarbamoyladenosine biosynthesis protein TsaB
MWLALDTATETVSVALDDGDAVWAEETWCGHRRTADVAAVVGRLLAAQGVAVAGLAGIAVAIGPGSYSGLRGGLALAKGLALAGGVPVVGVPTLDSLAAALLWPPASPAGPVWAVLPAGRGRVIAGCYPPPPGIWPAPEALEVWTVDELAERARPPDTVAGELDAATRRRLAAAGLRLLPAAAGLRRAGWLAELGRRQLAAHGPADLAELVPIYPPPGR